MGAGEDNRLSPVICDGAYFFSAFSAFFLILHGNFLCSMYLSMYRVDVYRKIFIEEGGQNEKEIKGYSDHFIHHDVFRHGAADSVSFDQWLSV